MSMFTEYDRRRMGDDPIYWRVAFDNCVCCLQSFDEYDYDQTQFFPYRFLKEAGANTFSRAVKYNDVPLMFELIATFKASGELEDI